MVFVLLGACWFLLAAWFYVQRLSTDVDAADGSAFITISEQEKRKHSNVESNGDSFNTEEFNHLLERIADGGEHGLIMREKALKQEKQLAIKNRLMLWETRLMTLK